MWDVETGVLVERLEGHRDSVYSIAFTPDDKGLVSGSLDRTLKFWDVSKLSMSDAKRKDGPGGSSSAISHDGKWVVSGSEDRGVQFWDTKSAAVQCMLQGHKNSVISVGLSPMGGLLATGSGDWQARICTSFIPRLMLTLSFVCTAQGAMNRSLSSQVSSNGGWTTKRTR